MAGISKRKWVSLILCLVLLLGAFSTYRVKAEQKPLWILTDFPSGTYLSEDEQKFNFTNHLEYVTGIKRENVNLEYLPTDETERSARITALRTEIMAGGGPDVFLLSCNLPRGKEGAACWDSISSRNEMKGITKQKSRLFLDPQKAMENHLFLPLDDYIETAQYFDPDLINPAVLAAGQTEEGQMALPITFTFSTAVYEKGAFNRRKAEEYARGATAWNRFPDLIGDLADYSSGKLLFSKAELLKAVQSALRGGPKAGADEMRFFRQSFSPEAAEGLSLVGPINHLDLAGWKPNQYTEQAAKNANQEIVPVQNIDGGITAEITAYACINLRTKYPETAFRVVDFLYKTELQSYAGNENDLQEPMSTLLHFTCFGVPARNDLMQSYSLSFQQFSVGGNDIDADNRSKVFHTYTSLRNEITTARFYGSLDEELQTMFNQCREAKTNEEIERIVSRSYDTMTIMLGE